MKKIVVLVDLTESSKPALLQASVIAKKSGAELTALHIASETSSDEVHVSHVESFVKKHMGEGLPFQVIIGHGKFLTAIPGYIDQLKPDLVVLCTHGIHGLAQNLFGADILKLVHHIQFPCLVVQENTVVNPNGIQKILIPASPYPDYMVKVKQASIIAKLFNAEILHYEIDKYVGNSEEEIAENKKLAEIYLNAEGIAFSTVFEDNKSMSLGYAGQTVQYAKSNGMDAIALTSDTHHEDMVMGKPDKEKFLTNELAIPILCCE
ncbi:MAG: universal stress protein [Flavobacteriales bacterium]